MHGLFKIGFEGGRAFKQAFVAIKIDGGASRGRRQRVAGIGVAVEHVDGMIRAGHELFVDAPVHNRAAHRHGAGGDTLGKGDDVGRDTETLRREPGAQAAEAGDHFVEDQQDAVLFGDGAEFFEIALWRRQHAGGARHRLHDHGRDGGGVVQGDDLLQFIGQMAAPHRLAFAERLFGAVIGGGQMAGRKGQRVEPAPVGADAAGRNARHTDTVIGAFAAHDAGARAFPAGAVPGHCDLHRSISSFRPRIGEEDMIEIAGRQCGDLGCSLERLGVAELEVWCEVERGGGFLNRLDDRGAAMPGVGAP